MALVQFHKMHGLGNDFAIFDARETMLETPAAQRLRALAHRQQGIGFDQMIILRASDRADVKMQIYNADGSQVGACGNATRCVVALLGRSVTIETDAGLLQGELLGETVRVNMGRPGLQWQDIPLDYAMDTLAMPVSWEGFENPAAVSMGNPHVIAFLGSAVAVQRFPLDKLGPKIEHDPLFPERVNVNLAAIDQGSITLRVWERGAGLTLACGTGACATAVAAIRRRLVSGPVMVHLPGGALEIDWREGEDVLMSGAVTHVYRGEIEL